jgi:hypothetical protein
MWSKDFEIIVPFRISCYFEMLMWEGYLRKDYDIFAIFGFTDAAVFSDNSAL